MLKVIETFTSIQGESTHQGELCFFIRLSGCNLRCRYCDTAYAWDGGEERTVAELVAEASHAGVPLVEITGGEPLIQSDTPELCRQLLTAGFTVLVETNGSLPVSVLPSNVTAVIDCKLPGSGMDSFNCEENFSHKIPNCEYKFVMSSRADFDYALNFIAKYGLDKRGVPLLASPVAGELLPSQLADWILRAKAPLRLQLQLHKQLWGDKRGV